MSRTADVHRVTHETSLSVKLDLDGAGAVKLDYPIGFMGHMLGAFARHGLFDLEIRARGNLEVDQHHLVEDTGVTLGQGFSQALGDRQGIFRNGSCLFPMGETLARAVVDISGRPMLIFDAGLSGIPLPGGPAPGPAHANGALGPALGPALTQSFQTDTIEDFWQGFVSAAGITLHLDILRGRSDHHKIEALFKAAARALRAACQFDSRAPGIIPPGKVYIA
jgi:imidazoleglycerol-phosphate dehydratase